MFEAQTSSLEAIESIPRAFLVCLSSYDIVNQWSDISIQTDLCARHRI